LEVVAKAICPLNFYSWLSVMCSAIVWTMSGLLSHRKNDQLRGSWFSWVWLRSSLLSWLQLRLLGVFTH